MEEEYTGQRGVITQATPVQIGMVLGIFGVIIGIVWGAANMSATMNAKLDVVIAKMGSLETANTSMRADLNGLLVWKAEIDRSGSKSLDELRKSFDQFKSEFQIHMAQAGIKR